MADTRKGDFPVAGDAVLAADGSVWLYVTEQVDPDNGSPPFVTGKWEQQAPHLSVAEIEAAEAADAARLSKLSAAHRVYAEAFGAVRFVKREADLNESDPVDAFVLALATSALRDAVIEVTAPDHTSVGLEARTESLLRTFLGDPEMGTVRGKLAALRAKVSDDTNPEGVAAQAREPLATLGELATNLPVDSEARATINLLVKPSGKPHPALADRLFRQLTQLGTDVPTLTKAYDAATRLLAAHGVQV